MGWAAGRLFNIRWRALFFIASAFVASTVLPNAAEARHGHHRPGSHHGSFHNARNHVVARYSVAHLSGVSLAARAWAKSVPSSSEPLMTIPQAKVLLRSVDAELAPAILTNLDLDFAKACLMAYGLKRLEEMKREAER